MTDIEMCINFARDKSHTSADRAKKELVALNRLARWAKKLQFVMECEETGERGHCPCCDGYLEHLRNCKLGKDIRSFQFLMGKKKEQVWYPDSDGGL